jgi:hypothetical protein
MAAEHRDTVWARPPSPSRSASSCRVRHPGSGAHPVGIVVVVKSVTHAEHLGGSTAVPPWSIPGTGAMG